MYIISYYHIAYLVENIIISCKYNKGIDLLANMADVLHNVMWGALKMTDMKLQDMKLTDRVAGHEIAGHENGGPNSRT